jgi:hypothetical protein
MMIKVPTPKLLECEKYGCGWQWIQRLQITKNSEGEIIKVDNPLPKNCSRCKSPTWNIPRD